MNPFSKKHKPKPDMSNSPISFETGGETIKHMYTPTPDMRTNPISLEPGGETVTIIYDGYAVEYTNIKKPVQYVTSVRKRSEKQIIGYILKGKTFIIN